MHPINLHINWIQNRNTSRPVSFLWAVYIVLTLFVLQLLMMPVTFSGWWHCPMMNNSTASISSSMDMEHCMHMQADATIEKKHDHHKKSQHGTVLCPLCASFSLPSPLSTDIFKIPAISVLMMTHQVKYYFSHAPPTIFIQNHQPRAPPIL